MCFSCDSGATTTSGIVWAMPVEVTKLGANLQAYVEQKPIITALRSCHRFGQGNDVFITRLPNELIDMIEKSLLAPARRRALAGWEKDFACFEDRCSPRDHLSEVEIAELKDRIRHNLIVDMHSDNDCSDSECECYSVGDTEVEELVDDKLLSPDTTGTFDAHCEARSNWIKRVLQCRSGVLLQDSRTNPQAQAKEGFAPFDKVLQEDFGLRAFVSHQRITRSMQPFLNHLSNRRVRYDETTISYLILPCQLAAEDLDNEDGYESDGYVHADSILCSVVEPSTLILTDEQRLRFSRARKVLGLEPYVHATQLQGSVSTSAPTHTINHVNGHGQVMKDFYKLSVEEQGELKKGVANHVTQLEQSEWPKLINLAASSYRL